MFVDIFEKICENKGIAPSAVLDGIGMHRSAYTNWKSGGEPSNPTKKKIADYFGITVSELMGGESQKEKPLINDDEELTEYLEELRTRPELQMLFQLSKKATKADVEKAVKIIEAFLGE